MIGSLVVGLEAKTEIKVKGLGGEVLHGLLFDVLRKTTPDIASKLHQLEDQKPFSLSPFLEGHELRQGYSHIASGRVVTFRLNLLTEELLTTAMRAFFASMAEGTIFNLSGKPVILCTINMCQTEVAPFTSFHKLLTEAHTETVLILEFLTPTSFKSDGIQMLFPEPGLVFSSLLRRWNFFSDMKLPQEYIELLPSIKVSSYSLRTELIHFSKYKMIGFKGRVEYRLPEKSLQHFHQALNALTDFAFYAGVGAKTTMGMGQTKRVNSQTRFTSGDRE